MKTPNASIAAFVRAAAIGSLRNFYRSISMGRTLPPPFQRCCFLIASVSISGSGEAARVQIV